MEPNLQALLRPRSVAVVGASEKLTRGTRMVSSLLRAEFSGPIYPVNPKYSEIQGLRCYPHLGALPDRVDCAVVAVPAPAAVRIVEDCATLGIPGAVVLASGFAESGTVGQELQRRLIEVATGRVAICGPNCLGFLNLHARVALSFVPPGTKPGSVSIASQSGVIGFSVAEQLGNRGVGISLLVNTGNEANINMADYLEFLVDDPHSRVILLYIESLKEPVRFQRAADRAHSLGKTVVALKVGKSDFSRTTALTHTGSLAGDDTAYEALFRRSGVIRVHDLDELVETAVIASVSKRPLGPGVLVMATSGGACALAGDVADEVGLDLTKLDQPTHAALEARLPEFASVNNPLDVTGGVTEDPTLYRDVLATLLKSPAVDVIAVHLSSGKGGEAGPIMQDRARMVAAAAATSEKLVVAFNSVSSGFDPDIVEVLGAAGVPVLEGLREPMLALQRLVWRWLRSPDRTTRNEMVDGARAEAARLLMRGFKGKPTERDTKALLGLYGIPVTSDRLATSANEASLIATELGYPVVLKVESAEILHKSEVGGVVLGLRSADQVATAYNQMMKTVHERAPQAAVNGIVVQRQVPEGSELILGIQHHKEFGHVIVLGIGGLWVEILNQAVVRLAPLEPFDVAEMLGSLPGKEVLMGARGESPRDVQAVAEVLANLSEMASELGDQLESLDLNPAIVHEQGFGLTVVDGLLVMRETLEVST